MKGHEAAPRKGIPCGGQSWDKAVQSPGGEAGWCAGWTEKADVAGRECLGAPGRQTR